MGPYELIEPPGSGGMVEVFKARDTRLDRTVAIKFLKTGHVERFRREAKAISSLNHPNICSLYDVGEEEGVDFPVMECTEGEPLSCSLPPAGALRYGIQIADALSAAHRKGIVHRDLKASNVMVGEHGLVKALDFGLARLTEAGPVGDDAAACMVEATTEKGTIVGTVACMSPEQAEGKPVDPHSDIFSFGSMLYERLTGQRAFRGDTKASTIAAILKEEPKPISQVSGDPHASFLDTGLTQLRHNASSRNAKKPQM